MKEQPDGRDYTNTRPSLVSVCHLDFLPGETKRIPFKVKGKDKDGKPAMVDNPHLAELEAVDDDGRPLHPLRKGKSPILAPGKVDMPAPREIPRPPSLADLDPIKALAMVRLCTDVEVLAGWANDPRPEIVTAIKARAEALVPPKP